MTIRIRKSSRYSVVDNQFMNDSRLSWKAKGVMVFLLSKPDDWKITLAHLAKASIDRIDSTRGALVELRKCGYLVGSDLYERPLENPRGAIGKSNERPLENPTLLSTDINTEPNTMAGGEKPSLEELIEAARHYKMTPEEREEQVRSFAYGNVAIDNPRVTRKMIDEEADKSLRAKSGFNLSLQQSPPSAPTPQVAATPLPHDGGGGEKVNEQNDTKPLDSTVTSGNIRADAAAGPGNAHRELIEFFTTEWAKTPPHAGIKYPFAPRDARHVKDLLAALGGDLAWAKRTIIKYLKTKEPFFGGHPMGKLVACLHQFMVSAAPLKRAESAKQTMECQE